MREFYADSCAAAANRTQSLKESRAKATGHTLALAANRRSRARQACANRVVACVRCSSLPRRVRSEGPPQFVSVQEFHQFEGLAVATP